METDTNRLLKSLQKDILQINSTVHLVSKELMSLFHEKNVSVEKSFSHPLQWNKFS